MASMGSIPFVAGMDFLQIGILHVGNRVIAESVGHASETGTADRGKRVEVVREAPGPIGQALDRSTAETGTSHNLRTDRTMTKLRDRKISQRTVEALYVKARVRVHEYPDGTIAVFHGPRCLARYHADGQPIDSQTREAA